MSKLLMEESHQGRVVHLVMNSPENLNAMDSGMAIAFREATTRLEQRDDCRLVVIRGNGRSFSAGGDLEMLRAKARKSVEENRRDMIDFYTSFLGLRELRVPLLCAVHGHAVGAGFCFAAACDIRLADETALLAAPFTRLALHPGMGGSYFLPRALGTEVAREMMLTGRRMGAEEARRHGFFCAVAGKAELVQEIDTWAHEILKSAPQATRALLTSERETQAAQVQATLEHEALEQARCYARPEFLEGVQALIEKRSPIW